MTPGNLLYGPDGQPRLPDLGDRLSIENLQSERDSAAASEHRSRQESLRRAFKGIVGAPTRRQRGLRSG